MNNTGEILQLKITYEVVVVVEEVVVLDVVDEDLVEEEEEEVVEDVVSVGLDTSSEPLPVESARRFGTYETR